MPHHDPRERANDSVLTAPVVRFRAPVARGLRTDSPVARRGGDRRAGLIQSASIITRGEAETHDFWIDDAFLGSVADAINATPAGTKIRFTHPGLSGDGLGKFLGRAKDAVVAGQRVLADVHLSETAHDTPDGDLADYIMDLAEADPAAFGVSISFMRDRKAEEDFTEEKGERSPDEDNSHNHPHIRLKKLYAADVVDDPAANPKGLFHRGQEIAQEADALLSYSFGLTDEVPELVELDIDPGRLSGFVGRFLDQHDLAIVRKEKEPEMATPMPDEAAAKIEGLSADELRDQGARRERERFAALKEKFDDAGFVLEQFAAGHDVDEAMSQWDQRELARVSEENERLGRENEELKRAGERSASSGAAPVSFNADAGEAGEGDFVQMAKARAKIDGCKLHEAMSKLARERPELHRSYVQAARAR